MFLYNFLSFDRDACGKKVQNLKTIKKSYFTFNKFFSLSAIICYQSFLWIPCCLISFDIGWQATIIVILTQILKTFEQSLLRLQVWIPKAYQPCVTVRRMFIETILAWSLKVNIFQINQYLFFGYFYVFPKLGIKPVYNQDNDIVEWDPWNSMKSFILLRSWILTIIDFKMVGLRKHKKNPNPNAILKWKAIFQLSHNINF